MKTDEIRERFLRFFQKRGHKIIASDSLLPHNDPTLLFTGAGMNQFKEQFLGLKPLGFNRVATCQKCLRTGDLDNVGVTRWHMTFFEMLGNFSFGDYFKKEACQWAWQFMLEEMGQKPEKLHVTIYENDDETFQIWSKLVGVPAERIWRFDEKSNFWPESAPSKGPNGPCGPCTEILIDTGVSTVPDSSPRNDSSRFVEVWNLVLQQFDRQEGGQLVPLPSRNIDTGMGLERMAAIMQGVPSAQDIDIVQPLVLAAAEQAGRTYTPGSPDADCRRLRRIAEHVRSVSFCIADGALPDRYGRGYVVRRIIRRAALDGRHLGVNGPFLYRLVPVVEKCMAGAYPEIRERLTTIQNILEGEEKRFAAALDDSPGIRLFEEVTAETAAGAPKRIPTERVFEFYDTYGIPLEFMEQRWEEEGVTFDRDGFEKALEARRAQSRAGSTMGDAAIVFKREFLSEDALDRLRRENINSEFVGYESTEGEATVLAILVDGQWRDAADPGEEAHVLLDRTPFYARSGGQVGDVGQLASETADAKVVDTILDHGFLVHLVTVEKGRLARRGRVRAAVDAATRLATARNHTATHVLQWALRTVLGEHVHQAGSDVGSARFRFDFTHPTALSPEERRRVETLVNERILQGAPVEAQYTTLEEARKRGAMALFGEKYGDEVRLVSIGGWSMELCGGTHMDQIGRIGLFKITGEESVAAGVRRITAVTGMGALQYLHDEEDRLAEVCKALKAGPDTLVARIENLQKEIKGLRGELAQARSLTKRGGGLDEVLQKVETVEGVPCVAAEVEGADANALREACDAARQKHASLLLVLGSREGDKVNLVAAATQDLTARGIHAGNLVREIAKEVDGGGGGRPDMGQAGGKKPDALPQALAKVPEVVRKQLAAKKG
ncbi:MAG: alanine--tRNA ligase [Planctomycetes bacterium]|nr:alanine--tRNA ligase [Planctomycetota bacterium]